MVNIYPSKIPTRPKSLPPPETAQLPSTHWKLSSPCSVEAALVSPPDDGRQTVAGSCFHPFLLLFAPKSLGGLGFGAGEATRCITAAAAHTTSPPALLDSASAQVGV